MSWEEYIQLSLHDPYIVEQNIGKGCLLYYGAAHTVDLEHRQFSEIEKWWQEIRPTLAFSEGGIWPLEKSREEAIQRHGEQGQLRFLAARDGIPIRSLEPDEAEEVKALLQHFSAERVKVFYVLRQVAQHRRMKQAEPIEEYVDKMLTKLSKVQGLEGAPRSLNEFEKIVSRAFPELSDWRQVPDSWFNPTKSETWTNEINRWLSRYRDEYMVKLLVQEVKKGERVFAVVGFSHVVMQERALRAALQ
jgi:hypothetical protein